jgi:hypothetical protein
MSETIYKTLTLKDLAEMMKFWGRIFINTERELALKLVATKGLGGKNRDQLTIQEIGIESLTKVMMDTNWIQVATRKRKESDLAFQKEEEEKLF